MGKHQSASTFWSKKYPPQEAVYKVSSDIQFPQKRHGLNPILKNSGFCQFLGERLLLCSVSQLGYEARLMKYLLVWQESQDGFEIVISHYHYHPFDQSWDSPPSLSRFPTGHILFVQSGWKNRTTINTIIYPTRKLTWQWKIHHLSRCMSY